MERESDLIIPWRLLAHPDLAAIRRRDDFLKDLKIQITDDGEIIADVPAINLERTNENER